MPWESAKIEDILRDMDAAISVAQICRAEKEEYERRVLLFLSRVRPCPLLQKMYGSMLGVFGISPKMISYKVPYVPNVDIVPRDGLYSGVVVTNPATISRKGSDLV